MPGFHVIGKILDCDGGIVGFNFQWAWAAGYPAGLEAAMPYADTGAQPYAAVFCGWSLLWSRRKQSR